MKKSFTGTAWITSISIWCLILLGQGTALAEPWRFIAVGDTRGNITPVNWAVLPEIAHEIVRHNPKFVIVPGDIVNTGSPENFQSWKAFMNPVYKAGIKVYPVIGNHDANAVAAFRQIFGPDIPDNGPPEELDRTYAIEYDNVLVLALDTYVNPGLVNQAWISQVLSTNTRPHVFAFGHMPAFKTHNAQCLDGDPEARDLFWQSLQSAGARIYFAGHDHYYDHARINDGDDVSDNDMHQLIVGGGGAPLHENYAYDGTNTVWLPRNVYHDRKYGYVLVEVDGNKISTQYYHRAGDYSYSPAGDSLTYTVDTRPAAPAGLITIEGPGNIALQWTASAGAASYSVKRSATFEGPYVNIIAGLTALTHTDTDVVEGQTYYYTVSAVNRAGESPDSVRSSAKPAEGFTGPFTLTVRKTGPQGFRLEWTESKDAVSYTVKRAQKSGGPYTTLASGLSRLHFEDTGLARGTYYYVVTAIGASGSRNSNQAAAARTPVWRVRERRKFK